VLVTLSAAGVELFEMFGWPKPKRGRLVDSERVPLHCVRVDWEGTSEFHILHRIYVEIGRKA
jgi:hypothetical protein